MAAWEAAVRQERKAFQVLMDGKQTGGLQAREHRKWFACLSDVLQFLYTDIEFAIDRKNPYLTVIYAIMHHMCLDLSKGYTPPLMAGTMGRGRKNMSAAEMLYVETAIEYLQAATTGIEYINGIGQVEDPQPVRTVAQSYGVSERTVRDWMKLVRRPRYHSVKRPSADDYRLWLESAAKRYREIGRSGAAIRRRNRKRLGAANK